MRQAGFTLIELLVVMGIISALVAIAVPQYNSYRQRAFDVRAEMDLRSIALAEEAHFLDIEEYLSCTDDECTALPGIRSLSKGVTVTVSATPSGFVGTSSHPKGSGKVFTWDSSAGGLQEVK